MTTEPCIQPRCVRGTAALVLAVSPSADRSPGGVDDAWAASLRRLDEALAASDTSAMLLSWHTACLEALASQRWEPMISLGHAALRIGHATRLTVAFAAKARHAFDIALYRAQKATSVDGVLRAAEGFANLGDPEAVEQSVDLAKALASRGHVERSKGTTH